MIGQFLILIRHSMVEVIPELPASAWHLSAIGRERALALANQLQMYHPTRVITSVEPKAVETGELIAEALHLPMNSISGLHEQERSQVPFTDRDWFEAQVKEFFASPDKVVFGDETADGAHSRFRRAIEDLVHHHPSENLAVVTHGTVLTLYVSRLTHIEPFAFWQQLGLPAFIVLSLSDKQVIAIQHEIE